MEAEGLSSARVLTLEGELQKQLDVGRRNEEEQRLNRMRLTEREKEVERAKVCDDDDVDDDGVVVVVVVVLLLLLLCLRDVVVVLCPVPFPSVCPPVISLPS